LKVISRGRWYFRQPSQKSRVISCGLDCFSSSAIRSWSERSFATFAITSEIGS
jgi:hypothetical protein